MSYTKQQLADLLRQVQIKKHGLTEEQIREAEQRAKAKKYSISIEKPHNGMVANQITDKSTSEVRQYYKRCEVVFSKGLQGSCEDRMLKAWHGRVNPVFRQMYAEWKRFADEVEAGQRSKKDKPKRPWM